MKLLSGLVVTVAVALLLFGWCLTMGMSETTAFAIAGATGLIGGIWSAVDAGRI